MIRTISAIVLTTALAACSTNVEVKSAGPKNTWTSARGLDDTVTCTIAALDREFTKKDKAWRYAAGVIVPDQVYEIRPTKLILHGDPIIVRIERAGAGSNIQLFTIPNYAKQHIAAIETCV